METTTPPVSEVKDQPDISSSQPLSQPTSSDNPPAPAPAAEHPAGAPNRLPEVSSLPSIDDHTLYWTTYDRIADAFDKELTDSWIKSLDGLLLFAALFSAINTAFIIESYQGLQADPAETTNALLRLLIIHRNDNVTLTAEDLDPIRPNPSAVSLNSIFFASLSFSLTAAFGAISAKQWLTEYLKVGPIKAIHAQGQKRHEKFKGLETWYFSLIMEMLPLLLQISLLLFLIGLVKFLWVIEQSVATMQLVLTAVGVAAYAITVIIGAFVPTSPFQTPLSKFISSYLGFLSNSKLWILLLGVLGYLLIPLLLTYVYVVDKFIFERILRSTETNLVEFVLDPLQGPMTHLNESLRSVSKWFTHLIPSSGMKSAWRFLKSWVGVRTSHPKPDNEELEIPEKWDSHEVLAAESVIWLLEHTEYPDAIMIALDASLRLPAGLLYSLLREREGLLDQLITFHNNLLPQTTERDLKWVESWQGRAIISGVILSRILSVGRNAYPKTNSWGSNAMPKPDRDVIWESPDVMIRALMAHRHRITGYESDITFSFSWLTPCLNVIAKASLVQSTDLTVNLADVGQAKTTSSITISVTPLQLALDSIIYALIKWEDFRNENDMLDALHGILRLRLPLSIISQIAIVIATFQWKVRSRKFWSHTPAYLECLIMRSNDNFDKVQMALDNVALALSLVDVGDIDPIPHMCCQLLAATEDLFSNAPEPSTIAQRKYHRYLSQSLLRLSRLMHNDTRTQERILRILSHCIGWVESSSAITMEYGNDIVLLVKYGVSLSVSGIGRNKAVCSRLICGLTEKLDDNMFGHIFISGDGVSLQSYSALDMTQVGIEFFRRLLSFEISDSSYQQGLIGGQFSVVIQYVVESRHFSDDDKPRVASLLARFLWKIMRNTEFQWPAYFPPLLIRALTSRSWSVGRLLMEHRMQDPWMAESVLLLWRYTRKELREGMLHPDWNDSIFFQSRMVDIMLEHYQNVKIQCYTGIDWHTLNDYFSSAPLPGSHQHLATSQNDLDEDNEGLMEARETMVVTPGISEEQAERIREVLESLSRLV